MNEKTTKEIKRGRRFTGWKGPSTRWRHFGVPGKGNPRRNKVTGEPWKPITLPKRRCMLLQQIDNKRARTVTFSDKRNKRVQKVNLHWKRFWWPEGERMVLLRVSCRAMRTIRKLGIDAAAKKYKLPLHKKKYSAGKSPRFRGHPENKYNRRIAGMTKAQFIKAQSMGQVKKEFVTQAAIDFLEFSRTNPTGAYDRKMADLVPDGLETEGMDMAELEALKMVRDRPAGEEEETFEFEAKEEEEEEDDDDEVSASGEDDIGYDPEFDIVEGDGDEGEETGEGVDWEYADESDADGEDVEWVYAEDADGEEGGWVEGEGGEGDGEEGEGE
uniref:50S ribosomal protein L28 n=1 Tax=Chromera velia CCMP2878 TaxID=1169474 RepID=A0A0G4F0X8_9ALVE|eukprot:Cvel_14556.t1-p1 / transcript=Cvel_14556.t1 / gene=Cvel_14556 / organism=Chromera_velia_CCMP2878 / gene_product=50S ribosomal protein L28, putative / transcript_product=50S ribosomal protein L28, putative / location=Cvel_scaffold1040:48712-49692(+) / protein_length=327 / sequence_SO=supercontig / SO=protein_coding / is_pseudo=false